MATPRALVDSSSAGLLSVITHATDPMVLADLPAVSGEDARVAAVNKAFCRLSARTSADLIEQGWLTLCGEGVDAPLIDRVKRALYRREHLVVDLPLARPDGLNVWTHCELLPVRDARGLATAILIIQRDISEQKQTRGMLTSLRAMTRRASHEVNNGLASVIINLSLSASTRATEDERCERIRDALNAAREAAETAKRLSALASNLEAPPAPRVDPAPDAAPRVDAATDGIAEPRDRAVRTPSEPATPASAPAPSDLARRASSPPAPPPPSISTVTRVESEADDSAVAAPESAAATEIETLGSVLILDDDEAVKDLLATYLDDRGYEVEATCESDQCIELYRNAFHAGHPFDLVILDLRIGHAGRGGMLTLAALKAIDPHVKAIAHSGYSTDDVMLNPQEFGFVAAIKKPTAPSEIARLLADLIRFHAP